MLRLSAFVAPMAMFIVVGVVPGQNRPQHDSQTCPGPIYDAKKLTRRARITESANLKAVYDALGRDAHGSVTLDTVLCRSGQVTDIKVTKSSSPELGQFVAAAVSLIRFTPAELNWHSVSQRQTFEFHLNDAHYYEIDPAYAAGRIIEAVQVIGNRRFTAAEILSWVHTQAGDKFNLDRIMDDVSAIRASGFFHDSQTGAWIENGVRDGVVVNFEVVELPLISDVKFDNLGDVDHAIILAALNEGRVDMRIGRPYGAEVGKAAIRIIKQVLASHGRPKADVKLLVENVTAQDVRLTFVIR